MRWGMRSGIIWVKLLDRHWGLNIVLDPNVTNAPLKAILLEARPYLAVAKLAGASGGGFFLFLAKSEDAARKFRTVLAQSSTGAGLRLAVGGRGDSGGGSRILALLGGSQLVALL